MKECYDCAKENLKYKTEEYENLQQINETLQEKVAELSGELAAYQNGNVNHSKLCLSPSSFRMVIKCHFRRKGQFIVR